MPTTCAICLRPLQEGRSHHSRCLKQLFGGTRCPSITFNRHALASVVIKGMVGRVSISGVQKKVALSLSPDRATLTVALEGTQFILKPETETYPELPANEHLTMRLGELFGLEIPACGLIRLTDETLAYLVRRFDRPEEGGKLLQEDFCQLAGLGPGDKYRGSAELCVKLLRQHASEPLIEIQKLYRLLLFSWWTGNGDMHLKNFSLLRTRDGIYRLSPAYDLLCTAVYPQLDNELALSIQGKKKNLGRGTWLKFARYSELPEKVALASLDRVAAVLDEAMELVEGSWLSDERKVAYRQYLQGTARKLRKS